MLIVFDVRGSSRLYLLKVKQSRRWKLLRTLPGLICVKINVHAKLCVNRNFFNGSGHDLDIILNIAVQAFITLFVFGCFCTSHENKVTRYNIFHFLIALPVLFIWGEP